VGAAEKAKGAAEKIKDAAEKAKIDRRHDDADGVSYGDLTSGEEPYVPDAYHPGPKFTQEQIDKAKAEQKSKR